MKVLLGFFVLWCAGLLVFDIVMAMSATGGFLAVFVICAFIEAAFLAWAAVMLVDELQS